MLVNGQGLHDGIWPAQHPWQLSDVVATGAGTWTHWSGSCTSTCMGMYCTAWCWGTRTCTALPSRYLARQITSARWTQPLTSSALFPMSIMLIPAGTMQVAVASNWQLPLVGDGQSCEAMSTACPDPPCCSAPQLHLFAFSDVAWNRPNISSATYIALRSYWAARNMTAGAMPLDGLPGSVISTEAIVSANLHRCKDIVERSVPCHADHAPARQCITAQPGASREAGGAEGGCCLCECPAPHLHASINSTFARTGLATGLVQRCQSLYQIQCSIDGHSSATSSVQVCLCKGHDSVAGAGDQNKRKQTVCEGLSN